MAQEIKTLAQWRLAVLERDGHTCQECGATNSLQVHHLKQRLLFPALQFEVSNGITLCKRCHSHKGKKGLEPGQPRPPGMERDSIRVDEDVMKLINKKGKFGDTPNRVLRRLLNIERGPYKRATAPRKKHKVLPLLTMKELRPVLASDEEYEAAKRGSRKISPAYWAEMERQLQEEIKKKKTSPPEGRPVLTVRGLLEATKKQLREVEAEIRRGKTP